MLELGRIMTRPPENMFIYVAVAGTSMDPLTACFRKSGHPIQALPLGQLSSPDLIKLAKVVVDTHKCPDLLYNRDFLRLLYDFGAIPRLAERLFIELFGYLDKGVKHNDIPYNSIYSTLMEVMRKMPQLRKGHALHLIKSIITQDKVSASEGLPGTPTLTLGQLESTGEIVLSRSGTEYGTIEVPFPKLSSLLEQCEDVPVKHRLRDICTSVEGGRLIKTWQPFEYFVRDYDAVKELFTADSIDKTCIIKDMYCASCNPAYSHLSVTLSSAVSTIAIRTRFPPLNSLIEGQTCETFDYLSTQYICKNAHGAPFDLFKVRCNNKGTSILMCFQVKLLQATKLSLSKLKAEVDKVRSSLAGTEFYDNHVLIVVATSLADGIDDDDIPDRCYLIRPERFADFFTPTLANRAFLYSQGKRLSVNVGTREELEGLSDVSAGISSDIVSERRKRAFADWDDLVARVKNIPLSIRSLVSFDPSI